MKTLVEYLKESLEDDEKGYLATKIRQIDWIF